MAVNTIYAQCWRKKRLIESVRVIIEQKNTRYPVPDELVTYIQCTEMYQCTPSELDKQDAMVIEKHWIIRNELLAIESRKQDKSSGTTQIDANENFDNIDFSNI